MMVLVVFVIRGSFCCLLWFFVAVVITSTIDYFAEVFCWYYNQPVGFSVQ